jgi:hypothetical protein
MGMSLEDEIASFLAEVETRAPASKLEPYAGLIRSLRQRRWTFAQIATALRERFNLSVAPSTIHNFLKVRAGRRALTETPSPGASSPGGIPAPPTPPRPRYHLDP